MLKESNDINEEDTTHCLNNVSVLDGRYRKIVQPVTSFFSEFSLIKTRFIIELRWLRFLIDHLPISNDKRLKKQEEEYFTQLESFSLIDAKHVKVLEAQTQHDVKAVEYFLQNCLQTAINNKTLSETMVKWKEFTHFCCTSEDINNLAYAFLIKQCLHTVLLPQYLTIIKRFSSLAQLYQHVAMLSRTHGQLAVPTTFGKEMAMFAYRLYRHTKSLKNVAIQAKFNGAVGNFNAHRFLYPELDWQQMTKTFVERFDLVYEPFSNQNESHDYIAEISHSLIRMHVVCLDAAQDIWHYISRDYLLLKKVETEVGSSTMPHKINPIDFENAEGNFGVANSLLEFFARKLCISRLQRDLSDSTVLRNLGSAFAYSLIALTSLAKGLSKIVLNEKVVCEELNTHWEILAEPVQILLRSEFVPYAYDVLKTMTRGVRSMNQNEYKELIKKLRSQITSEAYESLCSLTPQKYIGDSAKLTDQMLLQTNSFLE